MNLNVKVLKEEDYDNILVNWWKDWRWTPPSKDFLPDNGKGGYMVYEDNTPICAGFMYLTNSKVVWCDWIISDFKYKDKEKRKEAIVLLVSTISNMAVHLEKKYVYALLKNQPLINIYKELGYVEGNSYTQEMIKIL